MSFVSTRATSISVLKKNNPCHWNVAQVRKWAKDGGLRDEVVNALEKSFIDGPTLVYMSSTAVGELGSKTQLDKELWWETEQAKLLNNIVKIQKNWVQILMSSKIVKPDDS